MSQSDCTQSRPIDALQAAANIFSVNTLKHSFDLLRRSNPTLALLIQNHTVEHDRQPLNRNQELWIKLELPVETVCEIVTALSAIAEDAAKSRAEPREHRVTIHQTLLDWLMYAQSFLDDTDG